MKLEQNGNLLKIYKDKRVFIKDDKNHVQTDKPEKELKESSHPFSSIKNNSKY